MNKIFLLVVFIATVFIRTSSAQHDTAQTAALLPLYYNIKDALVGGNYSLVASNTDDLVKILNGLDAKSISVDSRNNLLEYAGKIVKSKDLKGQREHFAGLSTGFIALARSLKLSTQPVYQLYCPMKKSNWLSNEKAIKNPYYGSAMLTCGNVVGAVK
jgi:hypothetical protein